MWSYLETLAEWWQFQLPDTPIFLRKMRISWNSRPFVFVLTPTVLRPSSSWISCVCVGFGVLFLLFCPSWGEQRTNGFVSFKTLVGGWDVHCPGGLGRQVLTALFIVRSAWTLRRCVSQFYLVIAPLRFYPLIRSTSTLRYRSLFTLATFLRGFYPTSSETTQTKFGCQFFMSALVTCDSCQFSDVMLHLCCL